MLPKLLLTIVCYNGAIWAILLALLYWAGMDDPIFMGLIGLAGIAASTVATYRLMDDRGDSTVSQGRPTAGEVETLAPERPSQPAQPTPNLPYAVLQAMPQGVLIVDRARQILWCNQSAEQLLGAGLVGRSLMSVLRDPALLEVLDRMLARGEPAGEVDQLSAGGRTLSVDLRMLLEDGQPRAALILRDISAELRLESLRTDFIANVSHELKTPIATMIGFIETLRGPARSDVQAADRFLGIMQEQAERMNRLVSDLLSLSRIELNEHSRPMGLVDLNEVLTHVVDALSLKADARGMTLDMKAGVDLPKVQGESDQLIQVFQNLIENAIKYGRPQTSVTVAARLSSDPMALRSHLPALRQIDAMVSVSVADRGEGIAREHLPRLTERFYRVDAARSRDMGGTGLGLAIVKHVLNRHRGSLQIESTPGQGSTFTVHLPVALSKAAGEAESQSANATSV